MLLEICPSIARNPDVPGFMQGKRCDKVGFTVVTPVYVKGEETVEQDLNCSPSVAGTNVCNHKVEESSHVRMGKRTSAETGERALRVCTESESVGTFRLRRCHTRVPRSFTVK